MEIVRLKSSDYQELIDLLNYVFTIQNGKETDFEKELPKMCVKDDLYMGKHFAVKESGKIRAAIGVYPLPVDIMGKKLTFSTVGNVATHKDFEGMGFMRALMERSMEELKLIGADASRLCGVRQRYNRYGYETCGTLYNFTVGEYNCKTFFNGAKLNFQVINIEDIKNIKFCYDLYNKNAFKVERSPNNHYKDMFSSMVAWQNVAYLVTDNKGKNVGYVAAKENEEGIYEIAEINAIDNESFFDIVYNFQQFCGKDVKISVFPHDFQIIKEFIRVSEDYSITSPSHFKIINYEKIVDALLTLKTSYMQLESGSAVLDIKGYGAIEMFNDGRGVGCIKTEKTPDISLSAFEAIRLLFGSFAPAYNGVNNKIINSFCPLPLSWNLQDRV